MKEEYAAPKAEIISFEIAEDLLEPGGDASLIPGPPDDE
jgi:hypothetical protein